MNRLLETLKIVDGVNATDIKGAGVVGSYVSVANYRRFFATLQTGTVAEGKKATLTIMQAQDSAGTGAKPLKSVNSALAGVGGAKFLLTLEGSVNELDLANNYAYIAVKAVTDDTVAVPGMGILALGEPRYAPV